MCGIIGIIGDKDVSGRILSGLRRLEYRGYDSAGIAVVNDGHLVRRRAAGKLDALGQLLKDAPMDGRAGIGHTRWATHGEANEKNAHPHMTKHVAMVHNGIIENYRAIRDRLEAKGIHPEGESDTEVITLALDAYMQEGMSPQAAFAKLLTEIEGAFALAAVVDGTHNLILAARRGSPLVIGLGDGEMYLGSDAYALAGLTNRLIYLQEGDSAVLHPDAVHISDASGAQVEREISISQIDIGMADKGNHRHFMHKEIFEQPTVVAQTISRMLNHASGEFQLPFDMSELANVRRVTMIACGTAYYAAAVARYWFEQIAKLPCEVDIASEYRYREPVFDDGNLVIFVSQSGETADTLGALKLAKEAGQETLAVVNVAESSMAREAKLVLPTYAGPEIGVASTKAFTCQLAALACLVLSMAHARDVLTKDALADYLKQLEHLPQQMSVVLSQHDHLAAVAESLSDARDVLFVGRGVHFPLAMEGALKLKEISYIHAEGYAAGELKHGPIALIDENVPVIGIAPSHNLYEKTISNLSEIEARRGRVILISDKNTGTNDENFIEMPIADDLTSPILYALPIQLIAYHAAVARGTDVDQPRNLAKSVTVE